MAGMELLQFDTLLYLALEEITAEYDVPAALPRETSHTIVWSKMFKK